ncbi:MAG: gamma-glutamylcyclotransferase family protein [Methylomonas sp.]
MKSLFVYGTLKKNSRGEIHPFLRGQADFIGKSWLPGLLYDAGHYPAAIYLPAGGRSVVHGELYRLHDPERVLRLLDDYEECSAKFPEPREYRRSLIAAPLPGGVELTLAWVYLYNRPVTGLEPIADGDFKVDDEWRHAADLKLLI